ncbi:MAG: hypothetical protein KAS72_12390 [Phycisphaerales bacterium]|nr:hypothetical protein [Phycisphaerales bacterium]
MTPHTASRLILLGSLCISLALHGIGLAVITTTPWNAWFEAPEPSSLVAEPFDEQADDELITAGITEKTPATITWIGYDRYIEQYLPPSKVDQARMTDDGDARQPPGGAAAADATPTEQANAAATLSFVPTLAAGRERLEALRARLAEAIEPALVKFAAEAAAIRESQQADEDAEETLTEQTSASQDQPSLSGDALEADADGAGSDRESDAASATEEEVLEIRLGQPLAREGVEIRTKKPSISVVTRWTSVGARAPVARLYFRRDGTVKRVEIVQSTGYAQIDEDLIDSLYAWTAKGDLIDALGESETALFVVRILPP